MQISKKRQFLTVLITFFVLGASFKVMTLVEGLTEVRPVNGIPTVAGLICGPIGALACGLGNLLADFFGTFGPSSVLGVAANFIAAYLPYRLWHLFSEEPPNLHKGKNILLYLVISLVSALSVAWFLSFGLHIFFGTWMEQVYAYIFYNNFAFSVALGMPILILLTSDSVNMVCAKRPKPPRILQNIRARNLICGGYFILMLVMAICVLVFHLSPEESRWLDMLSLLAAAGLICLQV